MNKRLISGVLIASLVSTQLPIITLATNTLPKNEITGEINTVEPIEGGDIVENTESFENTSSEAVIPDQTENYSKAEIELLQKLQEAEVTRINSLSYVVEGGNIYFDPSTWTIVDADESVTNVVIPESINDISIRRIGDEAFRNCKSLENIVIPNSVTTIGGYAFIDCDDLKEIMIPNSVTTIEYGAFWSCDNLKEIVIPNSVTIIGSGIFEYCGNLESIVVPNSVTTIGDYAFRNCKSLESIVIPNSVTTIRSWTFWGCENLKEIIIPNSVTTIGERAFRDCDSLENIYYAGSKEEWDKIDIQGDNNLKSATIHYNSILYSKYFRKMWR